MSFLGSLGALMKGSGLEQVIGEIYATNSVPQMMSGKSVAIAFRAHTIVESAIMKLLLEITAYKYDLDLNVFNVCFDKAIKHELSSEVLITF